jgi:hypothetical protein
MAKAEGRGWKSYIPTPKTIVKVSLALFAFKLFSQYIVLPMQDKLPNVVKNAWPTV